MQLNGPHTDHEHASVSLKVLLLIFGLILIAVLGYFVWLQNAEPDSTANTAPTVKEEATTETTKTTSETTDSSDLKTHTNTEIGYSIKAPSNFTFSISETTPASSKIATITQNGKTTSAVNIECVSYGETLGSSDEGGTYKYTTFGDVIKRYKDAGYGQSFEGETTVNGNKAFIMGLGEGSLATDAQYVVEVKKGSCQLVGQKDIILTFDII